MKNIIPLLFLIAIVLFFATYGGLTATPKFWHDEAVPFEIARNIAEFGKADLAVAPNTFWEKSYMTHATGFPLTFSLAGVFKIFGVGVMQSRLFMIAWMFVALATLFFVIRAFFEDLAVKPPIGGFTALFSVLLVATFSSFYANGRTSTGEIPGFLFLLLALYFLYQKEWHGWGGFFAALAAVTKPSMYLLVLPAIVVSFFITPSNPPYLKGEDKTNSPLRVRGARGVTSLATGALPILLFWLWLINPAPFSIASWQEMIAFYQNAFNAPSLFSQFLTSASRPTVILNLLTHSTLVYFGILLAIIVSAWRKNLFSPAQNNLVRFLLLYGAFSFFYFLRSPGWFRYLLGTELLILALLPAALGKILKTLNYKTTWLGVVFFFFLYPRSSPAAAGSSHGALQKKKNTTSSPFLLFRNSRIKMLSALLLALALFQSLQYLLGAEIPSDAKSIDIARFINEEILVSDPTATIGFVDLTPVAALIPADRKYQRVAVGGYDTFVGKHSLSLPPNRLPTYFVSTNQKKNAGYEDVLKKFYQPYREAPHNVSVYKKSLTDQSN